MMFFKILLGIDVAVAVVVLYFFEVGLNDGSISSFNIYLWLEMVGCVGAVLIGGLTLSSYGHPRLAKAVLMVLAVPGVSYVLFFAMLIITHPRWN